MQIKKTETKTSADFGRVKSHITVLFTNGTEENGHWRENVLAHVKILKTTAGLGFCVARF